MPNTNSDENEEYTVNLRVTGMMCQRNCGTCNILFSIYGLFDKNGSKRFLQSWLLFCTSVNLFIVHV